MAGQHDTSDVTQPLYLDVIAFTISSSTFPSHQFWIQLAYIHSLTEMNPEDVATENMIDLTVPPAHVRQTCATDRCDSD